MRTPPDLNIMQRLAVVTTRRAVAAVRLAPLIALSLGACTESLPVTPSPVPPTQGGIVLGTDVSARGLLGTRWNVHTILAQPLPPAPDTTYRFRVQADRGVLALDARLGCNYFGGRVDTVGTRLQVPSLASTRIACTPPLLEIERRFGEAMGRVAYFGVRADTLWLYDGVFLEVMRLHAAP